MRYRQYIRVSSKAQLRGASLEDQERANVARVGQLGGTIEHTYTEPGRSAFTENLGKRQAFQQMLTDARARRFDALIIYDLSRFSRQAAVALTVAADLERLGITVISATEYFDRTTAAGRMTFTMLAAAAQFKSDHL
jgi:site-specific DNA recombinase